MERNPAINVEAGPCPCCGLAVAGAWLDAAGACELCAAPPFRRAPRACGGRHADELRISLVQWVRQGALTGWEAVAAASIDDAHRAGKLRELEAAGGGARWWIDEAAPDPTAWERMRRMWEVDRTIRATVEECQRQAMQPRAIRDQLQRRLARLSAAAGAPGIWTITIAGAGLDVSPPTAYIDPDTVATRRRATVDMLVREAAAN